MKPTTYAKVGEVFAKVCDLDGLERAERLDELCGDDAALRRDVETMLRHDVDEELIVADPGDAGGADGEPWPWPERIGPFRILGRIAEGGMGTVLEAEQDAPRRPVALKVIRGGFASSATLRRFEHEAHVLGLLQHPGIARIYEAGTADTGLGRQPYFAMERVEGRSIVEYAHARGLSTRARLELVARTCDAIHHAHQKGVIHRDLKPGNILVDEGTAPQSPARSGGESIGQPKVLDFGVARVTDADLRTTTLQTDVGQLVGTLPYMSPEQASGDPAEIDTRSDVYSLGVVTFELLTGNLPHSTDLRGMMIPDAVRVIRDGVTTRLGSVDARLRGDVETIVAKALASGKDDRYGSAAEMAADIRRYLVDEPIVARPPSTWYQLRKFAKRHRPLLSGLAAAFLLLLVALAATAYGLVEARRGERDALMIGDFWRQTLETSRPDADGIDVPMTTALLEAARLLDDPGSPYFALNPRVEARLRLTVGTTLGSHGEFEVAQLHLDRALALYREVDAPPEELAKAMHERARRHALDNELDEARMLWEERLSLPVGEEEQLRTRHHLAVLTRVEGDPESAAPLFTAILAERQSLLGETHPDTLVTKSALAKTYAMLGRYDEAERMFREILDTRRGLLGEADLMTLAAAKTLGNFLWRRGALDEAEALLRRTLELQLENPGEEHPDTLGTLGDLADVLMRNDDPEAAVEMLERLCRTLEETRGLEDGHTLVAMGGLASAYKRVGRRDDALRLREKVLLGRRNGPDPEGRATQIAMHNLGVEYRRAGRLDEAESLLLEVYALRLAQLGDDDLATRSTMDQIARVWLERRSTGEVSPREAAEEALAWTSRVTEDELAAPSESPDVVEGEFLTAHARALTTLERYDEAERAYLRSLEIFAQRYRATHSRIRKALEECVELYDVWGRPVPQHLHQHVAHLTGVQAP